MHALSPSESYATIFYDDIKFDKHLIFDRIFDDFRKIPKFTFFDLL